MVRGRWPWVFCKLVAPSRLHSRAVPLHSRRRDGASVATYIDPILMLTIASQTGGWVSCLSSSTDRRAVKSSWQAFCLKGVKRTLMIRVIEIRITHSRGWKLTQQAEWKAVLRRTLHEWMSWLTKTRLDHVHVFECGNLIYCSLSILSPWPNDQIVLVTEVFLSCPKPTKESRTLVHAQSRWDEPPSRGRRID